MKKILLIPVGGTICTDINDKGTLSVTAKAGMMLKYNFENSHSFYAGKADITLTNNLYILSENMTVEKWNLLIDTYREHVSKSEYDGVILAHGTDTLAYSAALFSILLSNTDIPVFFVSSHRRLEDPDTNGNENFRYAVECICRGIEPNVYVTYKNPSDNRMYLHLASRLTQCENYSDDFYSTDAFDISDISEENYSEYFKSIKKRYPADGRISAVDIKNRIKLSDCILMIKPYVGINYEAYDYSRFSAVLHGTFHSGTACAEKTETADKYGKNSILRMIDICSSPVTDTDVYLSPSKLCGEIYDTVRIIGSHTANNRQIKFIYGCTNEMTYVKLLIAYSVFDDKNKIDEFLNTECNFEFISQ